MVDEKIAEVDYGVKRRRGTLVTLQKMSENRIGRFAFDKTEKKKVDIYKNSNEGKKKYMVKWKLDFQRKLFDFKKFDISVKERGLSAQNLAKTQKNVMNNLIERFEKEIDLLQKLSIPNIN